MWRAGPGPLDRVIDIDANAARSEGEVHDADVGDIGQGQGRAANDAGGEAIYGQSQQAPGYDSYTFIMLIRFRKGLRLSQALAVKVFTAIITL
jgi:hypothetical protein